MAPAGGGYFSFRGFKIWYQTRGDLSTSVPLVLLHGGPGIPGNSYLPLMRQLLPRPTVRYDQLGCGRSDRPNDGAFFEEPNRYGEVLTAFLDRVEAGIASS